MKKRGKVPCMRRMRTAALFLLLSCIVLSAVGAGALSVGAAAERAMVSPALAVLAEQGAMAKATLCGTELSFSAEDFARAMNLSRVTSVTVTKAPPVPDGELRVGSGVITGGQTVSHENLELLRFVPSGDTPRETSFRFRVNGSPVEMTCRLYTLAELNAAPTLTMVPKATLNVSTHRNVTLWGDLPCYDPDGDETVVEIVRYPESGILVLTDSRRGEYTFTPGRNFSGEDSFTYVARDRYGNYSASATVSLTVKKPTTSTVYADLVDSRLCNAALTVTELGLMSGSQVGDATYFYPERSVSRGEFLVMAMNALGMTEVASGSTVFADGGEIPEPMRGYVATAYELGYVRGEPSGNALYFHPNRAITRAEATVILASMIDAATPTVKPVFSDASEIPAWAVASMESLSAMGILSASSDGRLSPMEELTRGEAAEMLCALRRAVEG